MDGWTGGWVSLYLRRERDGLAVAPEFHFFGQVLAGAVVGEMFGGRGGCRWVEWVMCRVMAQTHDRRCRFPPL